MRVYIKYEPTEGTVPEYAAGKINIKIKLPASYVSGPVSKIKDLFLEHYTKKHGGEIKKDEVRVVIPDGRQLADSAIASEYIKEHDEVRIEFGAPPEVTSALVLPPTGGAEEKAGDGTAHAGALLQCRNYGCMKKYLEAENSESACQHHTAPPLFREGKKQWSCCPHLSGWDWDEFMAIPGCVHTAHSTATPGATFAVSPTVAAAEVSASAASAPIRSIAQFNADNPTAPSSLTSLAKSMAPDAPKKLVIRADGKKQCVHFGCQQYFSDDENTGAPCKYHRLPPVFHEGMKYWGCCSGTKHIDFDDFLAHPGCQTGLHEAGTAV